MKLFLDITRVAYRLTGTTPTGIDRVEFAYADRILRDDAFRDCVCVFTAPFFTGALRRDLMLELLDRISAAWRTQMSAQDDAIYLALKSQLESPPELGETRRRFRNMSRIKHLRTHMVYPLRDLARSPVRLQRWFHRSRGAAPTYLNTSHNQLETPQRLAWAAPPAKPVFFVHDTIPIDYPEFVAAPSPGRHMRRMKTVSEMASLVIVNSRTTQAYLEEHLKRTGQRVPPSIVVPLGVADAFMALRTDALAGRLPPQSGHPYFVTLSTIEPRKNLLFLFAVWRRLVARRGPSAPRLVVAGQRGWENENIADILERSRDLGPFLVEVSDLCDHALAHLMSGATGLLQPSSVEGFGLPLIEGLTIGTPVVASDIPAHREVAGGQAEFIDAIDGPGWLSAIERLLDNPQIEQGRCQRLSTYVPLTWPAHVDLAMDAIRRMP